MGRKARKINKGEIIQKYQAHKRDTGSPKVQVAILTTRINNLAEHLRSHKKDSSSRRGLLKLVGQRRRMFQYIERTEGAAALKKVKKSLGAAE